MLPALAINNFEVESDQITMKLEMKTEKSLKNAKRHEWNGIEKWL